MPPLTITTPLSLSHVVKLTEEARPSQAKPSLHVMVQWLLSQVVRKDCGNVRKSKAGNRAGQQQ